MYESRFIPGEGNIFYCRRDMAWRKPGQGDLRGRLSPRKSGCCRGVGLRRYAAMPVWRRWRHPARQSDRLSRSYCHNRIKLLARFRAALKRVKQAVLSLAIMLHAAGFWVIRLITRRANHALSLLRELRPWHGGPACRYSVEAGGDGGGREWTVAPRDRGAARLPRPAVGAHATVVAPLTLPLTRAPPSPRLRGARGLAVDSLAALAGRAYSAGAAAGSFWPKLGVSVRSTSASGPSLGRFSSQLMAPSMSFSHISRGSS